MSKASETLKDLVNMLAKSDCNLDDDSILDIDDIPTAASDVEKAMTTRSIPHLSSHVARGAYASATTPVTRQNSRLEAPEGRAPLMPFHSVHAVENEYSACQAHGTTFKSTSGCQHCFLTKSYVCKNGDCGGDMMKTAGGTSCCQKCGA